MNFSLLEIFAKIRNTNIKQVSADYLASISPKTIRSPMPFLQFHRENKLINSFKFAEFYRID